MYKCLEPSVVNTNNCLLIECIACWNVRRDKLSRALGSAKLWLLYNVNCDQQHRKVSCWDFKISYWKSCKRLSRCSLIFFSRSSLCSSKMCFSAQVSCIIPISQNSHDVTNSKSRNPFRHRLQRFPPMSRSDSGFNHGSRHSIIISITSKPYSCFIHLYFHLSLIYTRREPKRLQRSR
jgi:hypothetical protein